MTFEQMQYVVAIAKYGTISKAAQVLNISHPAISRAITNLEIELGIHIFIRSRSGSRLTVEGEKVCAIANQIVELYDEVKKVNQDYILKGMINIFSYPIDDFFVFTPALKKFREEFPELTINISEQSISQIFESLRNNQIGIAFVLLTPSISETIKQEFDYTTLYNCKFCVICSEEHPYANESRLTLEQCQKYPLVVNTEPYIIKNISDMFQGIGTPQIMFYTNSDNLRRKILSDNHSLAFFSPATIINGQNAFEKNSHLKVIPVYNTHQNLNGQFICIYKKGRKLSFLERKLLSLIKKEISKSVKSRSFVMNELDK